MRTVTVCLAALLTTTSLIAQDQAKPKKPRRSLADGLVRHCIERDALEPPTLSAGLEMGAGKGAMVLLVRRPDGTLRIEELQRGLGDHGPAPEIKGVAPAEEIELDNNGKPKKPKAGAVVEAPPATIRIARSADTVTITTSADKVPMVGKSVNRKWLATQLAKCFAKTKKTSTEAQLLIEVSVNATMQETLACWEVARAAGFKTPMLSPKGRTRPPTADERQLISSIADKYEWPKKVMLGQPLYDGELLILLDGPTKVRDVMPLIMLCANAGIWQINFAGQKNPKKRFKLPMHIPYGQ